VVEGRVWVDAEHAIMGRRVYTATHLRSIKAE
jgi:hypothetical protein